jgi:hypothetical protein
MGRHGMCIRQPGSNRGACVPSWFILEPWGVLHWPTDLIWNMQLQKYV